MLFLALVAVAIWLNYRKRKRWEYAEVKEPEEEVGFPATPSDPIEAAMQYFRDAVRESDELIEAMECSETLKAELLEQKKHFEVALVALKEKWQNTDKVWISRRFIFPRDRQRGYMEMRDGLRLIFDEGKYIGFYTQNPCDR